MTEQPQNERDDEPDETRTWAPAEIESEQPGGAAVEDEQHQAMENAVEEGMPVVPQDQEPAVPEAPAAEPEVTETEPAGVETEPAAAAEPTLAVAETHEAEPVPSEAEPTIAVTEPVAAEPAVTEPETEVEVTAPTMPIGLSETIALPNEAPEPTQAIFRDSPTEAIPDPYADPQSEEAQKLAAERAARKEARDAALAAVAPAPVVAPEPVVIKHRTNDQFFGALGIFAFRLVVAGIFAIRGYQMLGDLAGTQERIASTLLAPYAQILAIVVGAAHLLIALALLLGLLTRVAGLGVLLVAGGALAFVWWGPWSPFIAGQPGFLGELELVLAASGLLLLLIGGGGWSLDRSFRSARAKDKAARQLAA